MKDNAIRLNIISWLFGIAVLVAGILNLFLVHPVPGVIYLLLSLVYFPPAIAVFEKRAGFGIPVIVRILLAIVIFMFTFGVSDLGDMID